LVNGQWTSNAYGASCTLWPAAADMTAEKCKQECAKFAPCVAAERSGSWPPAYDAPGVLRYNCQLWTALNTTSYITCPTGWTAHPSILTWDPNLKPDSWDTYVAKPWRDPSPINNGALYKTYAAPDTVCNTKN
jgi:hypothetical protein